MNKPDDHPHPCAYPASHHGRCLECGSTFIRREAAPQAFGFCSHACYDGNRHSQVEPDRRSSERSRP